MLNSQRGSNPYLVMFTGYRAGGIHTSVISEIGRIRPASEWVGLGFKVKFKADGMLAKPPISQKYRFLCPYRIAAEHEMGISSGLRVARLLGLSTLEELTLKGVPLSEYVGMDQHTRRYLRAVQLLAEGRDGLALPHLKAATDDVPGNRDYRNRYFSVLQQDGLAESITQEIEANIAAGEIPGCVHSGMVMGWIKRLYALGEKAIARDVIARLDHELRWACGNSQSENDKSWRLSKHAEFCKSVRAFGIKLEAYLAGAE